MTSPLRVVLVALVAIAACDSAGPSTDASTTDATNGDVSTADVTAIDTSVVDTSVVDTSSTDSSNTDASSDASVSADAAFDAATTDSSGSDAGGAFAITSPAFTHNTRIPDEHTCAGDNRAPALEWMNPPAGTLSFAVIMLDTNNNFMHWMIWNIGGDARSMMEATVPSGALQGRNGFTRSRYDGPCPPPDGDHRYRFRLHALDVATLPGLMNGSTRTAVEAAVASHSLASTDLVGLFSQ